MSINKKVSIVSISLLLLSGLGVAGYVLGFDQRILPHVRVGLVPVGGLTREAARERIQERLTRFQEDGVILDIEGKREIVRPEAVGLSVSPDALVDVAWRRGRTESFPERLGIWAMSPFVSYAVPTDVALERERLEDEMSILSEIIDQPRMDVRFDISGTKVGVRYDTKSGRVLDLQASADLVANAISLLDANPVRLTLSDDIPRALRDSASRAVQQAERMMSEPIIVTDGDYRSVIDRALIGSWIVSGYEGDQLIPALNAREISRYVTEIAEHTDVEPQQPRLDVVNGKVTNFTPPRSGRALEQDVTVARIMEILEARRDDRTLSEELSLPIKPVKPESEKIGSGHGGIIELIATATTPFTGSPNNRKSNIKNGVKFMSGVLIAPGQEFSTLKTLGRIDNTTGYLPELVIRGDRTTPEFGGGLCQVSTTLFRAALKAGLPITARRNHSFRISYYEKDGIDTYIGPGLDATIYEPGLDFKFRNDTPGSILIYGYVEGDTVTFELYGTHDGRTAKLEGPRILSETPAGDPIYTETDTLPKGTVKQVEIPHPGATTVADYAVTYPDGRVARQQFKSYYRRWPARFLVGTRG